MKRFDINKMSYKEWTYTDEDEKWNYGVILNPKEGITFWGEKTDKDDGGAYLMKFREFLRRKEFSTPKEIIDEIRSILLLAKK